MFADGYVGTAADASRIRRQEKEREKERQRYEAAAKAKADEAQKAGLKSFAATTTEALEHAFKNETIGLVTKAEFVKKRTTLQERLEEELKRKQALEEEAAAREKERKKQLKRAAGASKLSFAEPGEEEEAAAEEEGSQVLPPPALKKLLPPSAPAEQQQEQGQGQQAGNGVPAQGGDSCAGQRLERSESPEGEGPEAKRQRLMKKLGKDPTVTTSFLPDRERARQEEELKKQLKREWQAQQDKVKSEPLMIVYSYWDGSGHRREIKVKKGDTIGQFLKSVREQLLPDFRELRHVSVDNLMYIKEDIILPHHHSFYELIINKARGKSGPLFDFGVHEDIRVVNDASREKNESHAGKVVERHWYDRNKHIFPASRWEIYDPEKKFDSYSIYG